MLERLLNRSKAADSPTPASDTEESPAARPAAGTGEWVRQRAPLTDQDRVLLSHTHLWLRRIPTPLHPKQLCRYHPRIANRLAQNWDDAEATEQLFEELLVDRRGKRRGFGDRIMVEIQRLERFHARRPRFERTKPLSARLRAWARRGEAER